LASFLDGLDGQWRGLSLTMPLKQAVLPLLDGVSNLARDVAAANTVLLETVGAAARTRMCTASGRPCSRRG
jgi:shikimate dehydrogenase